MHWIYSINAIVLAHFILNLRSIYHINADPSKADKSLTIQFVSAIEGNMGTSLDGSWFTGMEVEASDEVEYANSPFEAGLFGTVEPGPLQNSRR